MTVRQVGLVGLTGRRYVKLGERAMCWECGALDITVNRDWTLHAHTSLGWRDRPRPEVVICHGPDSDFTFMDVLRRHRMMVPTSGRSR